MPFFIFLMSLSWSILSHIQGFFPSGLAVRSFWRENIPSKQIITLYQDKARPELPHRFHSEFLLVAIIELLQLSCEEAQSSWLKTSDRRNCVSCYRIYLQLLDNSWVSAKITFNVYNSKNTYFWKMDPIDFVQLFLLFLNFVQKFFLESVNT